MRLTDEQIAEIKARADWASGLPAGVVSAEKSIADRASLLTHCEALLAENAELQTRMAEGFAARDGQIENGAKMIEELKRKERGYHTHIYEAEQYLGKALGYPWYKDDQKNFPGATEKDGVCTGEHVVDTIAFEAANRIQHIEAENAKLRRVVEADFKLFHAKEYGTLNEHQQALRMRADALADLEPPNVPDATDDKG